MNIAEANLMQGSLDDLSRSILQDRMLKMRASENADKNKLASRELDLREQDLSDSRDNRRLALETQRGRYAEQQAHEQRLEALSKEGNADRRMKMGLDLLKELNDSGQLTDEGLNAMNQTFSKMFAPSGIGVKLFKTSPAREPRAWTSPAGQHYSIFGNTMMRDADPRPEVTMERDPFSGEMAPKSIRQRMTTADLDKAMALQGGGADPAAGPSPREQEEIDAILAAPAIPAHGPPPSQAGAGQPPRPAGKSDAELLREAASAIEKNPAAAEKIRERLKAWGIAMP